MSLNTGKCKPKVNGGHENLWVIKTVEVQVLTLCRNNCGTCQFTCIALLG